MKEGIWNIIEILTIFSGASFAVMGFVFVLYGVAIWQLFEFILGCLSYVVGLILLTLPLIISKFYPNTMKKNPVNR